MYHTSLLMYISDRNLLLIFFSNLFSLFSQLNIDKLSKDFIFFLSDDDFFFSCQYILLNY